MKIQLSYNQISYTADLSKPLDISIPLVPGSTGPKCFHAPDFKISPYQSGDFVGSVAAGAPVNFYNVEINPHGNGTHTECMGHISDKGYSINNELRQAHHIAELITITPSLLENGDRVISKKELDVLQEPNIPQALIIRTLPNDTSKKNRNYSDTNPPYFTTEALAFLVEKGIDHLLIDLPSVDREYDDGKLAGHKVFWGFPDEDRLHCTITEMIYIDEQIEDGRYLINIQIAPFEMDATPSKPVLYALKNMDNKINKLADLLDKAALSAQSIAQLKEEHNISLTEAYDIQAASISKRIERGDDLVGYKMGFTSKAKMEQMGVDDLIWGRLTQTMQIENGDSLDFSKFIHPRAEPEIAFLVKYDIGTALTLAEAKENVSSVAPAIEIIDSRYENFKFTLEDVVADNCSSSAFIVGEWKEVDTELSDLSMSISLDGEIQHEGNSDAILDDPWESFIEATRLITAYGETIKAGQIILAGAATPAVYVKSGQVAEAKVQGMSTVTLKIN